MADNINDYFFTTRKSTRTSITISYVILTIHRLPTCMWRDKVRRSDTDPVVMRSNPVTGHLYVVHCWLINPNKLNLFSSLLAYLSDK